MQFALLISVIIAILLSSFLLLTHVQSFFRIKSQMLISLSEFANTKLFESLDDTHISKDTLHTVTDGKTLKLASQYHGSWLKKVSEATEKSRKVAVVAFCGAAWNQRTPNLYLVNKNSPLVVVGASRLEGNSYLPKQGIKAGNISGNYYHGSRLYYGRTKESKETLPELDPQWISYIDRLKQGTYLEENQIVPLEKEITNSFHDTPKIIYNREPIILREEKITGNVIIQSATKITVTSASQITDAILIAPIIKVQNDVKGRFQSIATKKIDIGKRCHLSYPSSITLFDTQHGSAILQNNTAQQKMIDFIIDQNTRIEGSVVYLKKKQEAQNRIKTNLKIESNTEIIGEIYCQGNIEFLGTVKGSLYTRQFIANQSGSVYLNHLYNGKILLNPIPNYAGLPFKNLKKNIATWLY